MIERLVAIDWSGDKSVAGQRKKIWAAAWAETSKGPKVTLEAGRTREELTAWLIELAAETPAMVVGIDCCFSYPAWLLAENGCKTVFELWRCVSAGQGERWLGETCAADERDPRFWGKPHPRPEVFCGDGYPAMFRRTDLDNKIDQALEGGDPARAALMKGIQPKSPFQIGGAGAVGTGSIRAMPWLLRLRQAGFRIWPFDSATLPGNPLLVEMYTRLLTGPVAKSNPEARKAYLAARRRSDPLYSSLTRTVLAKAQSSEDAFDALVCCIEMVRYRDQFAGLKATTDPTLRLEGITWRPGVQVPNQNADVRG